MAEVLTLNIEKRENAGTGAARTLRRNGRVPAIVYGKNYPEIRISANLKELVSKYEKGHFTSKVVDLNLDGKTIKVVPKQVQLDPVTDVPLHVDFLRVDENSKIALKIPVKFINQDKAPGLKRGGVLNVIRRDVELLCNLDHIPEFLVADLAELQIGHSIHISHIKLPVDAEPTIKNRDFTIATIVGRTATSAEEEAAAAAAAAAAAEAAAAAAATAANDAAPAKKK